MTDSTSSPAALDGERRQATVLFADMQGYTALAEKLGEEDTFTLMQRIVEAVSAYGGTTQDLVGDGVMALFGAPHRDRGRAVARLPRRVGSGEHVASKHGVTPRFRGETQEAAANKLRRGIEVLGADAGEAVPYLLNLLGYSVEGDDFTKENSEVAGIRTRDLLIALLNERCAASQVLLVIEDLHWIDKASEELLTRIIGGAARLMVLCNYRPQYRAPWAARDNAGEMRVVPLSDHSTEDLLKHRLDVEEIPGDLTSLVVEKSEGNPCSPKRSRPYLIDKGVDEKVDAASGSTPGQPAPCRSISKTS